ncbi:hypothetical protein H9Y13_18785 [Aeromonas veronii]|uniref:hypothetical protein n=1 Tax=Aeromonas TaxID=642 RepID=UPI0022EAE86C|nr:MULTISPECIES: hypothetical protein [Aeromonas]KAJ8740058.1 hypothetical protein H9Y13_18785 [Aeromonas veronii]MDA3317876.1 hypothetical protein [Aeromonas sp. PI_26]
MIKTKRRVGRPRKEHTLDGAARSKRLRTKRAEEGTKELRLVLDTSTSDLFHALREQSGFAQREQSDFFAAMLLKVAGREWLGPAFTLPIEK